MTYFHYRKPYQYAKAGYYLPKVSYRLTVEQKIIITICWTICLILMGAIVFRYFFPLGL